MLTRIIDAKVEFFDRPFIKPLKLSTGAITQITEARAEVAVRVNDREAIGRGTIYLSDLWAWPDPALSHKVRDAKLRQLCEQVASDLPALCSNEPQHPLELGMRLHESVCRGDSPVATILARAMCASPFDAALHDAAGIATEQSAFGFYAEDVELPTVDRYFNRSSAISAIRSLLQPPRCQLDAWFIVSPDEPLQGDFAAAIRTHGYCCFKLKIRGRDNAEDVKRTIEVFRAVQLLGVRDVKLSIDSNEANADAASVLDYLETLRKTDGGAFEALQYIEQPTSRDITRHAFDWRDVAAIKPVMLDEGLTSLDLLADAKESGWSGLALKTCKGHSFALVAAAWARANGMLLSMQDLTNPGLSAIHAALFASRINTINGVELNANQFTPAANAEFLPQLSELLEPRDGVHVLREQRVYGLGSMLQQGAAI